MPIYYDCCCNTTTVFIRAWHLLENSSRSWCLYRPKWAVFVGPTKKSVGHQPILSLTTCWSVVDGPSSDRCLVPTRMGVPTFAQSHTNVCLSRVLCSVMTRCCLGGGNSPDSVRLGSRRTPGPRLLLGMLNQPLSVRNDATDNALMSRRQLARSTLTLPWVNDGGQWYG